MLFRKRLYKLKKEGFKLNQILIVDHTPEKSGSNYGNAICIKEFNGDRSDDEILHLRNYPLTLKSIESIRTIEKRGWRQKQGGT